MNTSTGWLQLSLIQGEKYSESELIAILKRTLCRLGSQPFVDSLKESSDMLKFMLYLESLWGLAPLEYMLHELTETELQVLQVLVQFAREPCDTTESKKSVTQSSLGDDC